MKAYYKNVRPGAIVSLGRPHKAKYVAFLRIFLALSTLMLYNILTENKENKDRYLRG